MSFRARLTVFFVAIVVVPMVSLAFVLFRLIEDNAESKADANTAAGQTAVRNAYAQAAGRAGRLAVRVGADRELATALRAGRAEDAAARARALLRPLGAARIRVEGRDGSTLLDVGRTDAVAPATNRLELSPGAPLGTLQVSALDAPAFVRQARRLTGLEVVVRTRRRLLGATGPAAATAPLPDLGTTSRGGRRFRVVSFRARGFGPERLRVGVLDARTKAEEQTGGQRLLAAGLLLGFFLLALVCAVLVSRSLQRSILVFLDAARRVGRGDFGARVPVQGRDEFAALGDEFNSMARELDARVQELARQRARLQTTVRRVGEAFASNLDRRGLLQLIVETTVDGVVADGGRARVSTEEAASGAAEGLEDVVAAAEAHVVESGDGHELTTAAGAALAQPLRGPTEGTAAGVVSVWRRGRPFTAAERELFTYLAVQGGASLENIALHETVRRQAVTDELTGLANHRAFQEALASEIERARRFGTTVGLVLIDIDDFKRVNDTHGHQTGDRVLAEVARVLREQSREVDEPARYGGEELAVVLPGADLEGAFGLAERVREAIAAIEVPLGGGRPPLTITASLGVATLPESAEGQVAVIAAADEALYEAKRSGKNRTVRAGTLRTHGTAR